MKRANIRRRESVVIGTGSSVHRISARCEDDVTSTVKIQGLFVAQVRANDVFAAAANRRMQSPPAM
jgi:hypothetical protein